MSPLHLFLPAHAQATPRQSDLIHYSASHPETIFESIPNHLAEQNAIEYHFGGEIMHLVILTQSSNEERLKFASSKDTG